ncbi:UNVERIFIED_ORG: H-NS histone family protein [Shinella sp. XGS7]|nr:H-NS histone family protein [Shinella sp. XGS7]
MWKNMAEVDVAKMSYAELVALRAKLEREIEGKREEELKTLADGYAKKLQAAGFSVEEGIKALLPYTEAKRRGSVGTSTSTARVLYRDPANPENTWSGRGQPARWLAQYVAAGRQREEFRVES